MRLIWEHKLGTLEFKEVKTMKKVFIALCSVCVLLLLFSLTACGSDESKVTGIMAGIGTEQNHPFVYGNPFEDNETITENDYVLQVGESYLLGVTFTQYGGSKVRSINTEIISLKYDAEVLEITPPEETEGMEVYYNLTCKKAIVYTTVIVEVDGEYSDTVIISAV